MGDDVTSIRADNTVFIDGMLWEGGYAKAVASNDRAMVRPVNVDRMTELRLRRQRRLAEADLSRMSPVLTEAHYGRWLAVQR